MSDFYSGYKTILDGFKAEDRLRSIPKEASGLLDLCSNDYLGLAARHSEFMEEFTERFHDIPMSASASRLLGEHQDIYARLEASLAEIYGRPALLFNSGYHANVGIIGSLASCGDTVFIADKLIHASAIDGLKMSGAEFTRFRHNDVGHLEKILSRYADRKRIVIMAESVYSMDGDLAPLADLVTLKQRFPNSILYLDEAHGFGTRGKLGAGLAEECGLTDEVDIIMGTFGKASASAGAFAVCNSTFKDYLINTSRPFIFSTALPPVNIAWTLLMVEKIKGMNAERKHLADISALFRNMLCEAFGSPSVSQSQIVPFLTGSSAKALELSLALRDNGINAMAIRRPTVPPGGERIRFSLNASLTPDDIAHIINVLRSNF